MYIIKTDYRTRIDVTLFDMLLAEDETNILADCSQVAEDTIRTYAGNLYDIEAELIKTGTSRNAYVKSLALSIALYEVLQRADDSDVPQKVIKNYDDTMKDLASISNSKKLLNLPTPPAPDTSVAAGDQTTSISGTGLRRMGSQKKRTHQV